MVAGDQASASVYVAGLVVLLADQIDLEVEQLLSIIPSRSWTDDVQFIVDGSVDISATNSAEPEEEKNFKTSHKKSLKFCAFCCYRCK